MMTEIDKITIHIIIRIMTRIMQRIMIGMMIMYFMKIQAVNMEMEIMKLLFVGKIFIFKVIIIMFSMIKSNKNRTRIIHVLMKIKII